MEPLKPLMEYKYCEVPFGTGSRLQLPSARAREADHTMDVYASGGWDLVSASPLMNSEGTPTGMTFVWARERPGQRHD